jgi:hypothetical protein
MESLFVGQLRIFLHVSLLFLVGLKSWLIYPLKKIKISTETVYRFVLQDKAIGGALYKYLRHQEWQSHLCVLYQ